MKLEVGERLVLLSILPQEGDFTTLKILRELKESLSFSEDEHKALGIKIENERVFWNNNGSAPKDIHFGEIATSMVKSALKKLNEEKKLRDEHFTLYEKFIGG